MTKQVKNKGGVKDGGEINVDAVLQAKIESVSKQIQDILKENGLGIQPVLDYSAYAIVPSVKLVKLNPQQNEQAKAE